MRIDLNSLDTLYSCSRISACTASTEDHTKVSILRYWTYAGISLSTGSWRRRHRRSASERRFREGETRCQLQLQHGDGHYTAFTVRQEVREPRAWISWLSRRRQLFSFLSTTSPFSDYWWELWTAEQQQWTGFFSTTVGSFHGSEWNLVWALSLFTQGMVNNIITDERSGCSLISRN